MAKQAVQVIGAERLAASLSYAAHQYDNLEQASSQTGRLISSRARGQAPKRTGRLARSLTAKADGSDVEVTSGLIYAPVIHNGWAGHHISPHPFLLPVAHSSEPVWRSFYAAELKTVLSHVKGA